MKRLYTHAKSANQDVKSRVWNKILLSFLLLTVLAGKGIAQTTLGGVNLGNLPQYLFVFTDGSGDANWQSASKGYVGDVAVYGTIADERTSGTVRVCGYHQNQ